jgi:hypothetical protein
MVHSQKQCDAIAAASLIGCAHEMRSRSLTWYLFFKRPLSGKMTIKIVLDMNELPRELHIALSKVARNGATQLTSSLTAMLAAVDRPGAPRR